MFRYFGTVFRNGWWCFGVSSGVSEKCFEVDGGVSVFRNSVSKWMVVFRNGWWCFGISGKSVSEIAKSGWWCGWWCFGISKRYFEKWMAVFRSGWQCLFRYFGVLVSRCFGILVFRYFGILVFRCFGILVFRIRHFGQCFGILGVWCFGVPSPADCGVTPVHVREPGY